MGNVTDALQVVLVTSRTGHPRDGNQPGFGRDGRVEIRIIDAIAPIADYGERHPPLVQPSLYLTSDAS